MALEDMMNARQREEELIVLVLAGTLLTRPQIKLLASLCAGTDKTTLEATLVALQPPEGNRGAPLLPYLVAGELKDFPSYANDIVSLLLGIFTGGGDFNKKAAEVVLGAAQVAVGNGRAVSVGSAAFYEDKGAGAWNTPAGLRKAGSQVPMSMLFAVQGLSERILGTGMNGMTPVKGSLPDSTRPASLGMTAPRAVAADPVLSAAASTAAGMEKAQ